MDEQKMIDSALDRTSKVDGEFPVFVESADGVRFALYGPVADGIYDPDLCRSVADLLVQVEQILSTGFAQGQAIRDIAERGHGTAAVVSFLDDVWYWEQC